MRRADMRHWRMVDTGLRRATENLALDRALLQSHSRGSSPCTLRFLRFSPCVLLGYHQNPEQEVNLEYLRDSGIELQRRMTGGGAIYFDPSHLGWELITHREVFDAADPSVVARQVCEIVAGAISTFGVDARFRPRNDIEVDGRKISGSGAAFDGRSLLYQGTLLVELDRMAMERALRTTSEKFADKSVACHSDRVVSLGELLGETPNLEELKAAIAEAVSRNLGVVFDVSEELLAEERALSRQCIAKMDRFEWVWGRRQSPDAPGLRAAMYRCRGATIGVTVRLDRWARRVSWIRISGDFFVEPPRVVLDLEAVLRNAAVADLDATVQAFFASREVRMLLLTPEDFIRAIRNAVHADCERE